VFRAPKACEVLLKYIDPKSSPFEVLALQLAVGAALNRQGSAKSAAEWLSEDELEVVSKAYHVKDEREKREVLRAQWAEEGQISKIAAVLNNHEMINELLERIFWESPTREEVRSWRRGEM
jgi:hypothetical protein